MFRELLRQKLKGILTLSEDQLESLKNHYELLLRWNPRLNLTSIESLEEAIERHYCESLFLAAQLPAGALNLADIGSGAGFPGIPVGIARRDCSVTLIEAHARKSVFLREATRHFSNFKIMPRRAEAAGEIFDCAVSRAVSYQDLRPILKKIAPKAHLLTGAEVPPPDLGFDWQPALRLPWGRQRFVRSGVSRETAKLGFT